MSLDSYIDNMIAQSKDSSGNVHIDKAVIIGLYDGVPWTSGNHHNAFRISSTEAETIARQLEVKDFKYFQANGITIEGVKYQFLREEDQKVLFAKRKDQGGVTLRATKTAIVIAHCPEERQQGYANKGIGVIADYLESNGQ